MKCHEAEVWILTVETEAEQPPEVRRHLHRCPRCRQQHARLQRLNESLRAVPLVERPGAAPQFQPRLHRPPRMLQEWRQPIRAAILVAAMLVPVGLALVFFLPPRSRPTQPETIVAAAHLSEPLVLRFLDRDLRLVETLAPEEQLKVLADMATDLRTEAVRLARAGAPDDLPLLAGLYERVVRQGLVGRVRALPNRAHPLIASTRKQLQEAESEVERTAKEVPPAVVAYIKPVALAARDAATELRD